MSEVLNEAVSVLAEKFPDGFNACAKFMVKDEGTIMLDHTGVRIGDEDADVTLTASAETFRAILQGEKSPTTAFMTGKLSIDGNMGLAMKLAALLA